MMTRRRFGDLADDIAARLPDREGLVFGTSRYPFRDVAARIAEAARRLIAAGVGHGEHVALWLNNCDDWIFISFAVQKIGAVLVPINTRFRSRDLAYVLAQSDSSFLITHDRSGPVDYAALVREAVALPAAGEDVRDPRFPMLRRVILLGESPQAGTVDWGALAGPAVGISADDLAARARRKLHVLEVPGCEWPGAARESPSIKRARGWRRRNAELPGLAAAPAERGPIRGERAAVGSACDNRRQGHRRDNRDCGIVTRPFRGRCDRGRARTYTLHDAVRGSGGYRGVTRLPRYGASSDLATRLVPRDRRQLLGRTDD